MTDQTYNYISLKNEEIKMREILFRAKSLIENKWVYGLPVYDGFADRDITSMCLKNISDGCSSNVKIDPRTIGQYTGLNDRNGNKIFEGDIVTDVWNESEHAFVSYGEYASVCGAISYHHGFYLKWITDFDGIRRNDIGYWWRNGIEVTGKIYDFLTLY